MIYIIKCLSGIHSKDEFLIKGGQEKEVSKEIYDYFNNTHGATGKFNFITKGTEKKPVTKKVVEPKETKKVIKDGK